MKALRYIFVAVFVVNGLAWLDNVLGRGWLDIPSPTLSEMALCALVVILSARKNYIYVNTGGGGRWEQREHCEV